MVSSEPIHAAVLHGFGQTPRYVVLNVATAGGTESNSFCGLAIGFTVATAAFAIGSLSGGAFNPAVALGATVDGIFAWGHIWIYLLANFAGGIVAAGVFLVTQPAEKPEAQARAAQTDGDIGRGAGPRVSPSTT